MHDYEKAKVEEDAKVFAALEALQAYAADYGGPSDDHKGCQPNLKALRVLVAAFPDGEPDAEANEAEYSRWFEALLQCYDYPEETMLEDNCANALDALARKYKGNEEHRKHFLSCLNEPLKQVALTAIA
jgi:hypothetical protein